nr:FAD-dependent oxidoreductase [Marinitoga lauensis]
MLINDDETIEFSEILVATGRIANTDKLGLENTKVKIGKKKEIIVDKYYQADKDIWQQEM